MVSNVALHHGSEVHRIDIVQQSWFALFAKPSIECRYSHADKLSRDSTVWPSGVGPAVRDAECTAAQIIHTMLAPLLSVRYANGSTSYIIPKRTSCNPMTESNVLGAQEANRRH
jgi:hypothetical protein